MIGLVSIRRSTLERRRRRIATDRDDTRLTSTVTLQDRPGTMTAMRHAELAEKECAVARTWAVIGERWTMMILRELFRGAHRFEDIQEKLQLGRNILADRLQVLVTEGVLERRLYQDRPPRHDYHLTAKGEDLYPVLLAVLRWGNRYMVEEPPLKLMHKACGHMVDPVVVCDGCKEELHRAGLRVYLAENAW
jgi:DNA-binding HxlR family transcriptional regulator